MAFGSRSAFLSLFTSFGTLVCCALPALLVTLGLGATLSTLVSSVPQLVWISEYKAEVFMGAAIMLSLAGYAQYQARNQPCPVDPKRARACMRTRRISLYIYIFSLVMYITGLSFAYIIPAFL